MSDRALHVIAPLWRRARIVAAMLIAGLWPGRDAPRIAAQIEAMTPRRQAEVVGSTLSFLFLLSLFAAQFGLLGMAVLFLSVIVIVA